MKRSEMGWLVGGVAVALLTVLAVAYWGETEDARSGITVETHSPYRPAAQAVDMSRIERDLRFLSSLSSRVPGRMGYEQAGAYLMQQLEEIGLQEIVAVTTEVVTPVDGQNLLTFDDMESMRLYPLWPNAARTNMTPPEGITGPLIYGGLGRAEDLSGLALEDSIVVLDWKAESEWLLAPSMGARAVVFLPNPDATRVHARGKYMTLPADLPRFYVAPSQAEQVRTRAQQALPMQATVISRQTWEPFVATSYLGLIPCGLPRPATTWEPLVLTAYYDSVSVVPALSPGAEQACGVAVLLELARYFKANPLEARDILFYVNGAHTPSMAGMKQFVRDYLLTPPEVEEDAEDDETPPELKPWLVASLDLSSGTQRLAVCHLGAFCNQFYMGIQPWLSAFGLRIARHADGIGEALGMDPQTLLVDAINPKRGRNMWVYFPYRPAFAHEPVTLAGFPAVTFATTDDARLRVDTPDDSFDALNLDNLERQARTLAALLANLGRMPGKVLSRDLPNLFSSLQGRAVMLDPETSYIPDKPMAGALIELKTYTSPKHQVGLRPVPRTIADASGEFFLDGLVHVSTNGALGRPEIEACVIDPITGNVTHANDQGDTRAQDYPTLVEMNEPLKNATIVLFPCESVSLYGLTDPLSYFSLTHASVFDAGTNSPPFQYGISRPDNVWHDRDESAVVIHAPTDAWLRITLGVGPLRNRLVLLNSSDENPLGTGFQVEKLANIHSLFYQGAWDMWRLNQHRLDTFHDVGVRPERVLRLHEEARTHLESASEALAARDYPAFLRSSYTGWSLEARAYPEILTTANDMINGVVFYLFLLLPFAYCFERLVVSAATINGRLIGISLTFLGGFLVLMVIHPAFRLTITPLLVLLAFIILALSMTVIVLVIGKFDRLMWEIRSAASGRHESDVNRMSAAGRAVDLGIANLRRRRQRTILTCTTLILVTFTLLSFTSIVPELRPRSVTYDDGKSVYDGLLFRDRTWQPMPLEQYQSLKLEHADKRPIVGRIWHFAEMVGQVSAIELFSGGRDIKRVTVQALVGLEADEPKVTGIDRALVAGRWFLPDETEAVILPERLAQLLGHGPDDLGEMVSVFGRDMPLVGLLDEAAFLDVVDIDGEPLTPVDYLLMAQRIEQEGPPDETEFERYIHLMPSDVAIVPFAYLKLIQPSVRGIAVRFDSGEEVLDELQEYIRRTELTVFASADGNVSVYSAVNTLSLAATGGLFIPVLIGGLIVLASMLGAVFERRREIGVFNAVGLAPLHVSSLFLAEATVFALLGGIAGYLIGQVTARSLIWFELLPGVTLNYSATSTVVVTVFTMLIAILSTIYPAMQAYRIATPEERSMFDHVEARGDEMEVDLPFTATGDDVLGVMAYLHEFLEAHVEASVGDLSAERIRIAAAHHTDGPRLRIDFRAWLAPFDLGVSQDVVVTSGFDPDCDGHRLTLSLARFSGDHGAWLRTNRHFMDVIRKQFLIWRIQGQEEKERYIERGKELFA